MTSEALEELTPEQVKHLSKLEARELFDDRQILVNRLRKEMDLLKEVIWPVPKITTCEKCGSKNIHLRQNGTYWCLCGFSSGLP